jgi:hypothetical protein
MTWINIGADELNVLPDLELKDIIKAVKGTRLTL